MMQRDPFEVLEEAGAVRIGHFVLTSGRHANRYLNKDDLYPHTVPTSELCRRIALSSGDDSIQTVAAPEKGGIILSQWVANHLTNMLSREVVAVYAEKDPKEGFVFTRLYDRFVTGRRVLVVEDVVTTGDSVHTVINAVRKLEGIVVGVGVLCNRSGKDTETLAKQFSVPWVQTLTTVSPTAWPSWMEEECPLCKQGTPVNTDIGKGKEFLARKASPV